MSKRSPRDTITTERVAKVVMILANNRGRNYTTAQIAHITQMSRSGAWMMMTKISRVLPIAQSQDGWMLLD
jgi:DNA-directed RNA polymerase specialized sigma subunit